MQQRARTRRRNANPRYVRVTLSLIFVPVPTSVSAVFLRTIIIVAAGVGNKSAARVDIMHANTYASHADWSDTPRHYGPLINCDLSVRKTYTADCRAEPPV